MKNNDRNINEENSRRKFIGQSATAGMGLLLAPTVLSAAGYGRPDKKSNHVDVNNISTRKLGKLEVSALGAGCMSISANYGAPAKPE